MTILNDACRSGSVVLLVFCCVGPLLVLIVSGTRKDGFCPNLCSFRIGANLSITYTRRQNSAATDQKVLIRQAFSSAFRYVQP